MDRKDRSAAARLWKAHQQGIEEALATGIVAEDVVVYLPPEMGLQSGTYRGREGYARHIADFYEAFSNVEQRILAATEHGPWLITEVAYRGKSSSGIPIDEALFWLSRWHDGQSAPLRDPLRTGVGRRVADRPDSE